MKEFYKTSEFWLTFVFIFFAGLGFGFGKLTMDQAIMIAGIGLGVSGYAVSRGLAKSAIVGLLVMVLIVPGCSHTQKIETAFKATQAISLIAAPILHAMCLEEATKCKEQNDDQCQAWAECDAKRYIVFKALKTAHIALSTALVMQSIGQEKEASNKLSVALKALSEANTLLKQYGVL